MREASDLFTGLRESGRTAIQRGNKTRCVCVCVCVCTLTHVEHFSGQSDTMRCCSGAGPRRASLPVLPEGPQAGKPEPAGDAFGKMTFSSPMPRTGTLGK